MSGIFTDLLRSVERRANPRNRNPRECARNRHLNDRGASITLHQFHPPRCGFCGSDLQRSSTPVEEA